MTKYIWLNGELGARVQRLEAGLFSPEPHSLSGKSEVFLAVKRWIPVSSQGSQCQWMIQGVLCNSRHVGCLRSLCRMGGTWGELRWMTTTWLRKGEVVLRDGRWHELRGKHASGDAGWIHWNSSELMEACSHQNMIRVWWVWWCRNTRNYLRIHRIWSLRM